MSSSPRARVVVLISGSGTNLQALMDTERAGDAPFQIVAVISNRPAAQGLQRAERASIPALTLDHTQFESREAFDDELRKLIDQYQPDLVVLAGFMRILSDAFTRHYEGRMLNIHPSLLPKHQGLHTHDRVLAAGDREHGTTVHFVTRELDGGPAAIQAQVPVYSDDDAQALAQRVQTQEHRIYPLAVQWFSEGRLTMKNGRALLDNEPLGPSGYLINTT